MAVLTTAARKKLPKRDFAIPGKKAFPMPDKAHAEAAIRLAPRSLHAGNISKAQEEHIDAMAHKKLGETPHKMAVNKQTGKVYRRPAMEMKMSQMGKYIAREKRKAANNAYRAG